MTENKLVSVVAPMLDEEKQIDAFLDCWVKQLHKPWEVVVVDGGSKDGSVDKAEKWKKVYKKNGIGLRIIKAKKGLIRQRDKGFRSAKGEIIVSADVDTVYPLKYVKFALSNLVGECVAVTGPNPVENPPWFVVLERRVGDWYKNTCYKILGSCRSVMAYNLVFIKNVYLSSEGMRGESPGEDQVGLIRILRQSGFVGYDKNLAPITSSRRHNKGGLFYFLFKTLLIDYWVGYFRSKYLNQEVEWKRVD